ncbi:Zinc finger BED domain-containing protein RICESLEEPER 4 [Bienertia sinuspersici]
MDLSSDESVSDQPKIVRETLTKNKKKGKQIKSKGGGKRKKSSVAWDHFETISDDDSLTRCIYCSAKIGSSTKNGTTAMKHHTQTCKKASFNLHKNQTVLDFESKIRVNTDKTIETIKVPELWQFNQDEIRKAFVKMLIIDELSFSFVEREGFRHFCKVVIPDFFLISRSTITRDCYGIYTKKRKQLETFLRIYPQECVLPPILRLLVKIYHTCVSLLILLMTIGK